VKRKQKKCKEKRWRVCVSRSDWALGSSERPRDAIASSYEPSA
jgi:hypothetical protein